MRVLVIGAFDPCCVHLRQRKWLKPLGIDVRIAVHERYWEEHAAVDWELPRDRDIVNQYARTADLWVFLPAIEQPWSSETGGPIVENFGELDWTAERPALFLIHGSRNAISHADYYAQIYGQRGMVAATTLDYVARLKCEYVPSIVDTVERAKPRGDDEPLKIVHAPSDPSLCSTSEFRHVAMGKGQLTYLNGMPHASAMRFKARQHVGFDHLRGSFSLNSLENATIGLVNLVGMSDAVMGEAERRGILPHWPHIRTMDDVSSWLERFQCDAKDTAWWQERGRLWADRYWKPEDVARRIANVYRKAARQ